MTVDCVLWPLSLPRQGPGLVFSLATVALSSGSFLDTMVPSTRTR